MKRDRIVIRANYESVPVAFDDILFIKALADYVIVKTTSGKHITLCTMKELQEKLPSDRFARAHRSYIVNLDKVSMVRGSNIEMSEREQRISIPIGRAYKKDFRQSMQAA